MSSKLSAYVLFQGQAREAMEFYRDVFGGTLEMNTFAEFGQTGPIEDQIMHGQLETSSGYTLMGADVPPGMEYSEGARVTLILHGEDDAELRGYFDRLAEGGQVDTPLEKQMWGDTYGQARDKFGVTWMVNISTPS